MKLDSTKKGLRRSQDQRMQSSTAGENSLEDARKNL